MMRLFFAIALLAACGADDPLDLSHRDARCGSSCPATMPPVEGAGDVCSITSRAQCLDECEARIANVPTVCSNCLLDNAHFAPPASDATMPGCGGGTGGSTCTVTGWNGT